MAASVSISSSQYHDRLASNRDSPNRGSSITDHATTHIGNSESNNTIVTANTDLLLTPSCSSQPGAVIVPIGEERESYHCSSSASLRRDATSKLNPSSPASPSSAKPPPRRRSTLKNIHRLVEQEESEPLCVILFKWGLILAGAAMLGIVMFIMADVIYGWASGTLVAQQMRKRERLASLGLDTNYSSTDVMEDAVNEPL